MIQVTGHVRTPSRMHVASGPCCAGAKSELPAQQSQDGAVQVGAAAHPAGLGALAAGLAGVCPQEGAPHQGAPGISTIPLAPLLRVGTQASCFKVAVEHGFSC